MACIHIHFQSSGLFELIAIVKTRNGNPVAVLRSLDDDSHVKTRIAQYEALHNGKGIAIAKTIVLSKIESQNMVLRKYKLEEHDLDIFKNKVEGLNYSSLNHIRRSLLQIEGKASERYFHEILAVA